MIVNIQATKRIYCLMCEIRDTIRNMDPPPEDPYLSLCIQSDGAITFNNTYWELPEEARINFHEDLQMRSNYTRRKPGDPHCPFNWPILCTSHNGRSFEDLPECCTKCGWNPEIEKKRKEVLRYGMEGRKTAES